MKLIATNAHQTPAKGQNDSATSENGAVELDLSNLNERAVLAFDAQLLAQAVIELPFVKAGDGRAYSHAALLRRAGYSGDIRAVGDVTVDYLLLMKRCGFTSAVLRADQNAAVGEQLLAHYERFYQASTGALDLHAPRVLEPA
jgi:uncharacterized protein (DUF934 family)